MVSDMKSKDLDLYVLAGQSNMQGAGWLVKGEAPHPDVWLFTSAGEWEVARDPLHRCLENYTPEVLERMKARNPARINRDILMEMARDARANPVQGVGPGLTFGKAMVAATGRPVGLIPAAHGGTSLDEWTPTPDDRAGRTLYGAMLHRIRRVTQTESAGVLKGILWYQGEADARDSTIAVTYMERFTRWVEAVRRDTGLPELPVVVVQLGPHVTVEYVEEKTAAWCSVRVAQARLPSQVALTGVTSAVDLPLEDSVHLSESAQRRLGRRLARRMLVLQQGVGSRTGPRIVRVERQPARQNGIGVLRVVVENIAGALRPATGISGFRVWEETPSGEFELRLIAADVEAMVDPRAPVQPEGHGAIRLLLNRDPNDSVRVGYGQSLMPFCNVTDELDDPLLASDCVVPDIGGDHPRPHAWYMRDKNHVNDCGKIVLGRMFTSAFDPAP